MNTTYTYPPGESEICDYCADELHLTDVFVVNVAAKTKIACNPCIVTYLSGEPIIDLDLASERRRLQNG